MKNIEPVCHPSGLWHAAFTCLTNRRPSTKTLFTNTHDYYARAKLGLAAAAYISPINMTGDIEGKS